MCTSCAVAARGLKPMMLAPSRATFSITLLLTNAVGWASTLVLAAPSSQSDQTEACAACAELADRGAEDSLTKKEHAFLDHVINCRIPEAPVEQEPDPEGKLQEVHVAYSSNARQFPGILLSMISLVRHMEKPETAVIHLIVSKEDWREAMKMVGCFNRSVSEVRALPRVVFHRLRPVGFNLSAVVQSWRPELLEQPHTFVRFYMQLYLRDAPRVLWLDSDTIIKADVAPLYRMKLKNPLAAALESGQESKGRLFVAAKWLNESVNSLEWNTGVLVYDLARWRSENISQQCNKWAVKVNAVAGDQIAMNLALFGRIDTIEDWRWNLRGWNFVRPPPVCLKTAKILHWSGRPELTVKPWQIGAESSHRHRWGYELVEPYILNPPCPLRNCSNAAVT
mmetsp:Transcript_27865/g.65759  ORF Transcript_27865/g.65759 Transcript_27865/m.65759 type:complete len:395 (+) Transcript_27865:124-1308(+)